MEESDCLLNYKDFFYLENLILKRCVCVKFEFSKGGKKIKIKLLEIVLARQLLNQMNQWYRACYIKV